ncbi:MAG: response regulator, partial [Bdellovibrionales bacterium]|nr:response regulator [Bdellovibrionales bacterium]
MDEANVFRSIFLIEDDPGHALLIKRALKGLTEHVVHAETLQQAYKMVGEECFELIISDLNLPDSTGVEHVGKLCQQCPDVPLVVLTSSTHLESAVEAMKLGARDYIIKDFDTNFREALSLSLTRVYAALELERERQKLLMAVERSEDGLAVVRNNGSILYGNSAFCDLLSLCEGSNGDFFSLFSDNVERSSSLAQTVEKALGELSEGAVFNTELTIVNPKERSFD